MYNSTLGPAISKKNISHDTIKYSYQHIGCFPLQCLMLVLHTLKLNWMLVLQRLRLKKMSDSSIVVDQLHLLLLFLNIMITSIIYVDIIVWYGTLQCLINVGAVLISGGSKMNFRTKPHRGGATRSKMSGWTWETKNLDTESFLDNLIHFLHQNLTIVCSKISID